MSNWKVAHRDGILPIERHLIDICGGMEIEQASAAGQIERKSARRKRRGGIWIVARVGLKSCGPALAWVRQGGIGHRSSRVIDAG